MKVLHLITSLDTGGAEVALQKLLAAQRPQRGDAVVVTLLGAGPIAPAIEALGVPVVALEMRSGRPALSALVALIGIIRRERPDVVQTWMYHADLMGGVTARLLGVPVVWGVRHGALGPGDKRLTRATRRACAVLSWVVPRRIVCNSSASIQIHVAAGYARSKFELIPNGFDTARFRPDPEARRDLRGTLGLAADAPVVGLVARYHPHKDHATFLAAAKLVGAGRPEARFVLCGEGVSWDNAALVDVVDRFGLREAVRLLGRRSDPERVCPALDVACLSSVTESFPNVLGEAMACGVPCVATDCGDVRDLLGATGRVVPVHDPGALAAAVLEMLRLPPARRAELGGEARERIVTLYDIHAVARRFGEVQRSAAR